MRTDEYRDTRLSTDDIVGADRDHSTHDDTHDDRSVATFGPSNSDSDSPQENQNSPQDNDDAPLELFGGEDVERFRVEWREIQARFVDDPRDAVQGADHLVAEVMRSLASTFSDHKHDLEGQWQDGSEAETEDLRQALRRYRTFFNQLLSS
jgi:hypothetical protein